MKEHIQQKIISLCGSQTELARRLGKTRRLYLSGFVLR
jgi:hypothetical protein